MAAPSHSPNSAIDTTVVYDSEGQAHKTQRLNAIELVRMGTHFWNAKDVGSTRTEADGPEDPTADTVTVFTVQDGTPVDVDRANARELVTSGLYVWNDPTGQKNVDEDAADDADDDASDDAVNEDDAASEDNDDAVVNTDPEVVAEDPVVDPANETLTQEAQRVTGSDDIVAYLEGFSLEALKTMASERFGETIHHRASKETAVQKVVEMEEARLVGDDQADA